MSDIYQSRWETFQPLMLVQPDQTKAKVDELLTGMGGPGVILQANPDVAWVLYEIAYGLHSPRQGYIYEFGTFRGGSAIVIGSGMRDSGNYHRPMVTVDLYPQPETEPMIHQFELEKHICRALCNDLELYEGVLVNSTPIQFLYFDSDHSEQHTYEVLTVCFPHIMSGGWLGVHDYVHSDFSNAIPGVNRFLDENPGLRVNRSEGDTLIVIQKG